MKTVKLIQYMHPGGKQEEVSVEQPDDVFEMAKGQILSCELMPNDYSKVIFYSRKKEWEEEREEIMFAENGPGNNSPQVVLERLIRLANSK